MNRITRGALTLATAGAALGIVGAPIGGANASETEHAVFVQTVEATGNHVLAFTPGRNGALSPAGSYATGGTGAFATGAVVDPLASQGGLAYDEEHELLIAVNSGSDTISVFAVHGARLTLRQTLPSGGAFPASVAVHDGVVQVLNAGGAGSVAGFRVRGRQLEPVAGSVRSLGLTNADVPFFLTSPGQVGYTADGEHVVVTTKANNTILTFAVDERGRLAAAPVSTTATGTVPFSFESTRGGDLAVVEAGTGTVTTYCVQPDGALATRSSVADGQRAACWITRVGGTFYVGNAGSANLSGVTIGRDGQAALVGATGVVTATGAGPVDMAASQDGRVLYSQQGGAHAVEAFKVGRDGTLTSLGSVTGLPAMEGNVAI